jgi:replication factor A1
MIQQSYDSIVNKIVASTGLKREEVEEKITNKMKELQDLISKEGAAHMIANELKVKLFNIQEQKELKIRDILPGLNALSIAGKVVSVNEPRTFESKGRTGRLASLILADETGSIRVTIWDDKLIDELKNIKEGYIVKVLNAYSKLNNNFKELHLGNHAQIIINPKDVIIGEIVRTNTKRKTIAEFNPDEIVETFGTIVQIF